MGGNKKENTISNKENLVHYFKMGELHKYQYDYFKLLTTLCSGLILIFAGAFLQGFLSNRECICLIFLAFLSFVVCEASSVIALPNVGNQLGYLNTAVINMMIGESIKASESVEKYCDDKGIKALSLVSVISFLSGFGFLILFLIANL